MDLSTRLIQSRRMFWRFRLGEIMADPDGRRTNEPRPALAGDLHLGFISAFHAAKAPNAFFGDNGDERPTRAAGNWETRARMELLFAGP